MLNNKIPTAQIKIGINYLLTNVTERFEVKTARERLIKFFKENPTELQYCGVPYERGTELTVEVIAEFNENVVCTEEFIVNDEILGERPYDEKFSNALVAMGILRDSLEFAKKDIAFLGKTDGENGVYGKTKLQSDFAEIEKAFLVQHKYMLELVKEIQKTYKMN